jgi:hypothetical protein
MTKLRYEKYDRCGKIYQKIFFSNLSYYLHFYQSYYYINFTVIILSTRSVK